MLKGHMGGVRHGSFSRNGRLLITASEDKTVKVGDVSVVSCATSTRCANRYHRMYLPECDHGCVSEK